MEVLQQFNVSTRVLNLTNAQHFLWPVLLYSLGIVVYAIFIFKFYRFIAARDIFKLNLNKYNQSPHPLLNKIFASFFFIVEYILFFPIIIFLWFLVLTAFLAVMAKQQDLALTIILSMTLVIAIRVTSYYSEDLSRDLAKMIPFALLGVFLIDVSFFDYRQSLNTFLQIPSQWEGFVYFLAFLMMLELILRIIRGIFLSIFHPKDEIPTPDEPEE